MSSARDDMPREEYEPMDPATLPPLRKPGSDRLARRSFHQAPSFGADTIADDLRWQLDRLRAAGLDQVLVVDLTRPEWQLPVVRVIVPGLELHGEDRKYLPGRRALQKLMRQRLTSSSSSARPSSTAFWTYLGLGCDQT